MDFERWGQQYLSQAEQIYRKIEGLKMEMKSLSGGQQDAIYYRIGLLYQMYLELRHTGLYLKQQHRRHTG